MSTTLTAVLQQLLQNTTNLAVLKQLMTPDATYVSLNFDDPELKKIMPWTGTHKRGQALSDGQAREAQRAGSLQERNRYVHSVRVNDTVGLLARVPKRIGQIFTTLP
jgi:hypothetical protein